MGKHSPNRIEVFLSTPMPSGNTHWQFLRESIDAFFAFSDLNSLFQLTIIESEGGAPPEQIYKSMVEKADILLAVFGNEIPSGQYSEIVVAKSKGKIVFGFFLNYKPMDGNGQKDHKILYDVGTINPVASHYDLFSAIRTQFLGYFTHSIHDVKKVTPQQIERELELAFEEDSDELLDRAGELIERVGTDDADVYLMSIIYMMKVGIETSSLVDKRIIDLAKENELAWKILLAIAFTRKDKDTLNLCLSIDKFCQDADMLRNLFDMTIDKHSHPGLLENDIFIKSVQHLSRDTVYSCPIFEDTADEVLMHY